MKRAHFLFAALSFAWASAVAAPFEAVVSRAGEVRLFDPTQPMSGTNPVTVDSGLASDPPFGVLKGGTLSDGRLSHMENSLLGYLKGRQLYIVSLAAAAGARSPRRARSSRRSSPSSSPRRGMPRGRAARRGSARDAGETT